MASFSLLYISLEMVRWPSTYLENKEAKKSWKTENKEANPQKVRVTVTEMEKCSESQAVFWFLFLELIFT